MKSMRKSPRVGPGNGILRVYIISLLTLAAAAFVQHAPALQAAQAPSAGQTNGTSAPAAPGAGRTITLDVQVTDKSGTPIRGLHQEDFTLLDDNQPEPITSFQAVDRAAPAPTDPPVEVELIIDAVNAGFLTVSYERDQIKKFLLHEGGELPQPVSLIGFTDSGAKALGPPSRDGNALMSEFEDYETGLRTVTRSQGFYGATERFSASLNALAALTALQASRPGRKLMIWISPGWPLFSGPNVGVSSQEEQKLFNLIVKEFAEFDQAGVTVYTIDPLGGSDIATNQLYKDYLKGVKSPSSAQPGNAGLQVFSVQSGGRVLTPINDIAGAIDQCAADAAAYYILTFNALPADRANEYHSLQIKVDKPGSVARTRTEYYAQP